ncbi:MAG TPA: hypothetical protein VEK07_18375 [Polyangiaceae bacterium]|nr:hypothetical protein [Polyangiaceae bacterium]
MNEARRRLACAFVVVVMPVWWGCGRTQAGEGRAPLSEGAALASHREGFVDAAGRPDRSSPGAAVAATRCRASESGFVIEGERPVLAASETRGPSDSAADRTPGLGAPNGGDAVGEVEIGDALAEVEGYAVSVIHRTAAGRTCSVAHLGPGGNGPVRLVELGATLGDAPPARLVRRGTELLAAAYSAPGSGRGGGLTRELALYAVGDAGTAIRTGAVAQQRDDSLAFDIASSGRSLLVVWDEAAPGPRGVIRAAVSAAGSTAFGSSRDVSPTDRDAESPRLVYSDHFVVFWLARRPEPSLDAALAPPSAEAVGEARAYGWLESEDLDDRGVPVGVPRPLTSTSGHVSAYDVAALADGSILVVARDEGEAVEGIGGRLLRIRVAVGGVDPPLAYAIDGLGSCAPVLVAGSPPWLSWVGPGEHLRLLPLDETGAPAGPSSDEDAMSDGRPLLALGPRGDGMQPLLVAFPSRADGQLRRFACTR